MAFAYKDIAVFPGLPVGMVKSRIDREIVQLREILLPDTQLPPSGHGEWDLSPTFGLEPFHRF